MLPSLNTSNKIGAEVTFPHKNLESALLNIVYNETLNNKQTETINSSIPSEDIMDYHDICLQNRERIIDWIIQVLHVLNVTNPSTFFTAASLLDRYLIAKWQEGTPLGPESLYLIGMTSIFISSKIEDVVAIKAATLLEKAGHGKFTQSDFLNMEREIMKSLNFRLKITDRGSLYDEAMLDFKATVAKTLVSDLIKV